MYKSCIEFSRLTNNYQISNEIEMKTIDKILNGIRQLLLNEGFTALTVRAVAKEAGVNHGLVRYHFGSKEKMVIAMIDRESGEILQKVKNAGSQGSPEKFRRSIIETLISSKSSSKLLLECLLVSNIMPEVREKMLQILSSRRQFIKEGLGIQNPLDLLVLQANIFGLLVLRNLDSETPLEQGMAHLFSLLGLGTHTTQENVSPQEG